MTIGMKLLSLIRQSVFLSLREVSFNATLFGTNISRETENKKKGGGGVEAYPAGNTTAKLESITALSVVRDAQRCLVCPRRNSQSKFKLVVRKKSSKRNTRN